MSILNTSRIKPFLLLVLIAMSIAVMGQKQRIYHPDIYYTNIQSNDFKNQFSSATVKNFSLFHPDILSQLQKVIPPSKWDYFLEFSQRENYPAHFKIFSDYELGLLTMYHLCEFSFNKLDFSIIEVPAAENKHLPEGLRPATDIYFVCNYYSLMDESGMSNKQKNKESHYQKKVKLRTEFNAALKLKEGKFLDTNLYFKTIVNLPNRSREYYAQKYQDALKAADNREKADLAAYQEMKNRGETEKQARIQKKKDEIANYTREILALNKPLLEAYQAGNDQEVLMHYRYWSGSSIQYEDVMPKISGQLNEPPHYSYYQKSRFQFYSKPDSFDLICNTNLRCMISSQFFNTRQENFIITESFQITKDPHVFRNPNYGKDGVYTNNEFYQEPWNYFAKYITENVNEVVASEFKIVVVDNIVTLQFKSKDFKEGRNYWPEEIFELIAKVRDAQHVIENIGRE